MKQFQKFVVALVGAITTAVSLGLLPEEWNQYVAVAVAFLTAAGVWVVKNAPPPVVTLTQPPYTPEATDAD